MDEAALGLKVDATGVQAATKALEDFVDQGAKTEKAMAGVEGAAAKTGKSLKTLGDGASKGLDDIGKSAPAAAESVGRVAKSAEDAKRALADMNASAAGLGRISTASRDAASGVKSLSDASDSLGANMSLAVRGVQSLLALQIVGWATDAAKSLYEASASAERLRISLDFSSVRGSAAEIAYLRKTTFDLGLSFESTAKAYQQFSAAARSTSLEGDKARAIFESVAKASAVMGLSADQTSGVLLALQQMISKGTVQSEELRGQLGERLPGAFQTAARAMGVTTAELGKMLEQGQVVADDFLPKFAQELDRSLGGAAEKAANRLDAAVNKFDNAWQRLKQNVGDSGVSNAMASGFNSASGALDALSVSMEQARANGSGFFGQAAAAIGTMYDLGNSTDRVKVNMYDNAKAMAEAQKELDRLQRLAETPGSGRWVLTEIGNVNRYIATLQAARRERDALTSGGLATANTEGMGNSRTIIKRREDEAASEKALADVRQRATGINKQYFADLKTYQDALALGTIDQKQYIAGVSELAKRTWDSSVAGKEAAKRAKAGASGATRIAKADLASDLADIQIQYRMLTTASGNAERLLDAQRAAGLVSEREYYAQKRKFVEDNAALQIRELEDENKRYAQQAATGADKINNEKKIAQNTAKMAEIRAKADTDIKISTLQQEEANRQLEASYKALEQSMAGYLKTSADRYQRELQGMGLGNQWRDQNAAANQINDRYEAQRNDLRNNRERLELEKKWNSDLEEQYQRRLEIINDANQKALGLDADYWRRRLQLQQDWTVGASEALTNYLNEANNTAALTERAFTNGISGMEDALVSFVTTGKLSFTQLANSILADITRIIIKQQLAAAIGGGGGMNWLGGLVGGLFGTTGTAAVASALPGNSLDNFLNLNNNFVANAKGGVYDSPSLSMYSNQVHSTPKVFAFAKGAGVFAEAGPEAIMPLTRNSAGVLGVRAMRDTAGGDGAGNSRRSGAPININIPVEGRVDRSTKDQIAARAAQALRRAERLS